MDKQVNPSPGEPKPRTTWKWIAALSVLLAVSQCGEEQGGSSYASRVAQDSINTVVNWTWGGR